MSDDIEFDRSQTTPAGEVADLSPLVRRVIAGNGGPMTFTGTCSYIVGRGTVAIIDPGPDDADHVTRLLAVLERLVVLLPQIWEERRDRGIAYADLGDDTAAARDLTLYLENVPDAQDPDAIAERLARLGHTGSSAPPRLH